MTNEELKAALISRKPVVLRQNSRDSILCKRVSAIRYTLDNNGEIVVQAELLDKNSNSIIIAKASGVCLADSTNGGTGE